MSNELNGDFKKLPVVTKWAASSVLGGGGLPPLELSKSSLEANPTILEIASLPLACGLLPPKFLKI